MARKGQFVDLKVRLERNVEPCPTTGCWLFVGKLDKDGYGNLHNRSGGDHKAHRLSWEVYRGHIPEGMEVAHHCDVRCCVNPGHLYPATHQQNLADRTARMREPRGEKCSWAKLTGEAVKEIRLSKEHADDLAIKFGVSRAQIYRAKNGENWSHLK